MIRVVLDTSIFVAAARSRKGASHALISRLPTRVYEPAISVPLFVEYREALLRPENRLTRTPEQVETFLDGLLAFSHLQEIFFLWRPGLADPKDDFVLEVAVAANCPFIITHNVRDFKGAQMFGIEVEAPGKFIKRLEMES